MDYLVHLSILFSIYGILAVSLNLVVGYTGLLSLAHAAFYGLGAYATAILITGFGLNFFPATLLSMILVMIISGLIGLVLSKFKGDYYALGSMGFSVIIFSIFFNWQSLTNGPLGIGGIAKPALFGLDFSGNLAFLCLSLLFLVIAYGLSEAIVKTPFGRALKAIREDESTAQVFGYRTLYFKLAVFVISAALAALAGSLFASYITFIDPLSFTLMESIFIMAIIILGGLANHKGALLGALLLILLPEILRFIGFPVDIAAYMRQVTYGLILIGLMLYRPRGLLGEYKL